MSRTAVIRKNGKTLLSGRLLACAVSGTILGLLDCILSLTDHLVSGRLLGEHALSGLTVVTPFITLLTFINIIVPIGVTVAIAFAQGEGNAEKADRLYSQGMIVSILSGVFFTILLFVISFFAFDRIPISPEMKGFAGAYCKGLLLMPLFLFFNTFLYYIQVGEGYESICVVSSVARLVVNITLDIVLCRIWGTFGIGVATMLGYLSAVLVKLIPVIRRRLSLHFRFFFSMKVLLKTISNGFLLSADVICPVLFAMIMNFTMLTVYGEDSLIVFSVILNIARCFMALYFCLSNSIQSIVCQYHGERNFVNIRRTMNYMQKYLLLISGILIGLILGFSGLIPGAFGITNADRYRDTAFAIRCFAPFVVCLGLDALFARYYVCIRHRALGFFLILFSSTIFPIAFQFLFNGIFGIKGIWAGLGAGYMAALILLPLLLAGIRKKSSRRLSAILLCDVETEERQLSYDLKSTKEEVMSCVHDIDKILKERKEPDSRKRNRLVQMAEENGMNLVDRYRSDPVNIEVSVICPKGSPEEYTLVIRTNGILSDVTDEDLRLTSFREYYLSSLMPVMEERSFIKKKAETTMIFR